jgi:colanic acid/amylovoran biosynthesis glycosyltransferase
MEQCMNIPASANVPNADLAGPVSPANACVRRLLVLAPLPAVQNDQGAWMLPAKFVNGMKKYAERWPGPVVVGLQAGTEATGDLDNRYWSPSELPFEVCRVSFPELANSGGPLLQGSIILVTLNHQLYGLAERCQAQDAILVTNTELTLTTQLQIAKSVHGWGPRLLKAALWLGLNHRRAMREIRSAHGLQCNGTPTFEAFSRHSPSPLLYFDNRTTADLCASPADIEARFGNLSRRRRLRLLFSGRLHPIKGVHHLVPMAQLLRAQGVDFELWIAGDGPLRADIEAQVVSHGLQEQVRLLGTLDFQQELMPMLRREIDLFVCPHLQGDPSCTYLETLCGGVPIVGYANEAWLGMHRLSAAGRLCDLGQPRALASAVASLSNDFTSLRQLADRALDFSSQHVFDAEFETRIVHLLHFCSTKSPPT